MSNPEAGTNALEFALSNGIKSVRSTHPAFHRENVGILGYWNTGIMGFGKMGEWDIVKISP